MTAAAPTITITVNGEPKTFPAGLTLADLLERLGLRPDAVVVEHNRAIVRRAALGAATVQAGDEVELVHFVGGG